MPSAGAEGRVADAVRGNWVDRLAPPATRPYLRLSRADRPIGTWLLLIPCWWGLLLAAAADPGGLRPFDVWIALGCALGAVLMRGAGCTWNDLTDRDIDARVARTRSRPLPSGQVTPRAGRGLDGGAGARRLRDPADLPGAGDRARRRLAGAGRDLSRSPSASPGGRRSSSASPSTGACCSAGRRTPAGSAPPALLLYAAGIAWTLFYDTIYAHQDREDDALIGVRSTARLFGAATQAAGSPASSPPPPRSPRSAVVAAGLRPAGARRGARRGRRLRAAPRLAAPPARHRRRRRSA